MRVDLKARPHKVSTTDLGQLPFWEPYLRQCSSIDAKWLLLKNRLAEGIEKFVPKISNFYEWRKPSWKCPLPRDVQEKIRYKYRLWNRYIETKDLQYLTKYN